MNLSKQKEIYSLIGTQNWSLRYGWNAQIVEWSIQRIAKS